MAQWSPHMKRELKPEEREEIISAVAAGDRVKATNIYLSATEGNQTMRRAIRVPLPPTGKKAKRKVWRKKQR